ncbi:translocon-associated protein subunit beta-like [Gigantopelta aegis]|uniref:translocon-associated protein subunit beta-like n=1 Tax=Gigantopelta aegis TaxID=1735272 RepID=UPI001B88C7C3|nr:translocon-associated protein subunit beta-like [Gigantopelta aegis]
MFRLCAVVTSFFVFGEDNVWQMKMWLTGVLLTIMLLAVGQADEDTEARLLASKSILNQYLVEGKHLTVEYKIYNIGGSAALDVQLADDGFPEADFDIVRGNPKVSWTRIAPNTNVTHAIILRPTKSGYFNFTAAQVSYLATEEAKEKQLGYTSAPGEGAIVNKKEFERRFSPHVLDWLVFAVMTLPSLGIPFLLWFGSKKKYDTPKPKKTQ